MAFKGKREPGAEYFDDVIDRSGVGGMGQAGVLGGIGLDDYDGVQEKVQQDGVEITINCRFCNSKRGIVLEWPELFQVGMNGPGFPPLLPQGWQFSQNNGTAVFIHRCPGCSQPQGLAVHMTPDEARRHIESAVAAGLVAPQQVAAWRQQIAQLRQQYQR